MMWKLGLALMGGVMLSRSFIQSSVDRQCCVPSLLFDVENGDLLQRKENPMDRGAWRATVHGVTKSRT